MDARNNPYIPLSSDNALDDRSEICSLLTSGSSRYSLPEACERPSPRCF